MAENKFYFTNTDDEDEDHLSRSTCHPNFVKDFDSEFYYDCLEEFSPFGNDDGHDMLYHLEDWYKTTGGKGDVIKWLIETINDFGFKYTAEPLLQITDPGILAQLLEEEPSLLGTMDNSIVAAAFGQYRITGELNKELRKIALTALKRKMIVVEISEMDSSDSIQSVNRQMALDLMKIT
jgi:uncharacterized protein YfeS